MAGNSTLSGSFQEIKRLKAINDDRAMEEAGLKAKLEAIEKINESKEKEIAEKDSECDDLDDKINNLVQRNAALDLTIQHLGETRESIVRDLETKTRQAQELEKQVQEQESLNQNSLQDFEGLLNAVSDDVMCLIPELMDHYSIYIESLEYRTKIDPLEERLSKLRSEMATIEKKEAAAKEESERFELLQQQLTTLTKKNEELTQEVAKLQAMAKQNKKPELNDSGIATFNETPVAPARVDEDDDEYGTPGSRFSDASAPHGPVAAGESLDPGTPAVPRTPVREKQQVPMETCATPPPPSASKSTIDLNKTRDVTEAGNLMNETQILPHGYGKAQSTPAAMTSLSGLLRTSEVSKMMLSAAAPPPVTPITRPVTLQKEMRTPPESVRKPPTIKTPGSQERGQNRFSLFDEATSSQQNIVKKTPETIRIVSPQSGGPSVARSKIPMPQKTAIAKVNPSGSSNVKSPKTAHAPPAPPNDMASRDQAPQGTTASKTMDESQTEIDANLCQEQTCTQDSVGNYRASRPRLPTPNMPPPNSQSVSTVVSSNQEGLNFGDDGSAGEIAGCSKSSFDMHDYLRHNANAAPPIKPSKSSSMNAAFFNGGAGPMKFDF